MANGTLKVQNIETSSGSGTITLGQSGESLALGASNISGFGKVGQVVYNSSTTEVTTSSSTFVTTNFSLSITPTSTSSKILILLNPHLRLYNSSGADAHGEYKIDNGTSALYTNQLRIYDYGNSGSLININPNIVYYDSPASTSQQTYTLFIRLIAGTNIQFCQSSLISTGTAMEVLP